MTTELLGLCSPGVRNEKHSVVCDQLLLQLHCAVRIDVLRVVGNDSLSDGLADSVDLGGVSSTLYADADIDGGESLLTGDENGLVDLEAEDLRLEETDGGTVDVNEAATLFGVGYCSRSLPITNQMRIECAMTVLCSGDIPSFYRTFGQPLLLTPFCQRRGVERLGRSKVFSRIFQSVDSRRSSKRLKTSIVVSPECHPDPSDSIHPAPMRFST